MSVWAKKRQLGYILLITGVISVVVAGYSYFNRANPTCSDRKQNQDERGVDCGGVCLSPCRADLIGLKILWTRVLPVGNNHYDVVSLVENLNKKYGVPAVRYQFNVEDKNSLPLKERSGVTFINPEEKFLVFESRVSTAPRVASRAFLYFNPTMEWQKMEKAKPVLSIEGKEYTAEPTPRLKALVKNNTLEPIREVVVGVVLSDADQNALAASMTTIDRIERGETKEIYFTWPESFSSAPVLFDFYPRVNLYAPEF